jgi:hypothetical protein
MKPPYVPATEQLVVEVYVRDLDRALDFYRSLGCSSSTSSPISSRRRHPGPTCA